MLNTNHSIRLALVNGLFYVILLSKLFCSIFGGIYRKVAVVSRKYPAACRHGILSRGIFYVVLYIHGKKQAFVESLALWNVHTAIS